MSETMNHDMSGAGAASGHTLYAFAYGSNMDVEHLNAFAQERGYGAGLFRAVGPAVLPDVELAFNRYSKRRRGGALNIRACRGSLVSGLLLEVAPRGWDALADKEGVNSGAYAPVRRHAIGPAGEAIPVVTYISSPVDPSAHHKPAPGYAETVQAAYERHGFDAGPLQAAIEGVSGAACLDAAFFYGTLQRGEYRGEIVAHHEPSCLILGHAPGTLADLGAYPAMSLPRPGEREGWVQGEFVRFPDMGNALRQFDGIEGAEPYGAPGGLYRRTVIEVGVGDGRARQAWTYVSDHTGAGDRPALPSGSWRDRHGRASRAVQAVVAAHAARQTDFFQRLAEEVRSPYRPDAPPPFALTIEGVAEAVIAGEVSERSLARASGCWAVQIPALWREPAAV